MRHIKPNKYQIDSRIRINKLALFMIQSLCIPKIDHIQARIKLILIANTDIAVGIKICQTYKYILKSLVKLNGQ